MKHFSPILVVLLLAIPCAMANGSSDSYVKALKTISWKCNHLSVTNKINEQIKEMQVKSGQVTFDHYSDLVMEDNKKLDSCVKEAKKKGAIIYKRYMRGPNKKTMKEDAKQVFLTWLPYLSAMAFDEYPTDTSAYSDFNKAVSTMRADALVQ